MVPMEVSTSNEATLSLVQQSLPLTPQALDHLRRHCFGDSTPGQFPLSAHPDVVLHILSSYNLDHHSLALLEATSKFFRHAANFNPYFDLSMTEVAALEMCRQRAIFKPMTSDERETMKQRCGGSWKLVLRFLMMGEANYRREKFQAIAGPSHSIVVASNGDVYSFGQNKSGQLGHGNLETVYKPQIIRSLQGIRIIHAAVGDQRTMLVSDIGRVYTFGNNLFADFNLDQDEDEDDDEVAEDVVMTPKPLESLKDIFVIQATIGGCFSAVLSREGRVYTLSWGRDAGRLGHMTDFDREPRLLEGTLEELPVVQISAGFCYLLALAVHPSGTSIYSLGCGLGGKLGHGTKTSEKHPRLIEHFQTLNFKPIAIAAGTWHAVALGQDGRVCTWGWGNYGPLGHGSEECETLPRVVEALTDIKTVHIAAGAYTTFVVSEGGDVYSFGYGGSSSLGISTEPEGMNVLKPQLISSLKQEKDGERIVQINTTASATGNRFHSFVLTDSGKLYSFGSGRKGQLGAQLSGAQTKRKNPELVNIDLC